jgi:ubiquinone/menaquinone biosynthesis C-methylase UbiE
MEYEKQVNKDHYSFNRYFFKERWMSYWYQVNEICKRPEIESVLDIGPGTTFLHDVLKIHQPNITYKTLDIAADVHPDFIGGITQIPLQDEAFDLVSAFQVLEHIEYSDVEKALLEMKRVSKQYVFVSLPHFGPSVEFLLKVPFLKRFKFAFKIPYRPKHTFGGQHYWEIGKAGYSPQKIRTLMQKHFDILDEYVPFEYQYHHFFIMRKK